MKPNWLRTLATRPALRISLAVLLILIGLAPIGQPILSDSSWRDGRCACGDKRPPATPERRRRLPTARTRRATP